MSNSVRAVVAGLLLTILALAWMVFSEDRVADTKLDTPTTAGESTRSMVVPAGRVRDPLLPAESDGEPPQPLPPPEAAAGDSALATWDPDDPVGLLIYGAVYDPEGQLVTGQGGVQWMTTAGKRHSARLADGTYALAGLRPGKGGLSAGMQGAVPYELALELKPDQPVTRVDIHLEAAVSLCVSVLDPAGNQLWDTLPIDKFDRPRYGVLATPEPLGRSVAPIAHRLIDRNEHGLWISRFETWGSRTVEAGCEGMLDLVSPLPLWVSLLHRSEVVASQFVEEGATEVVFVLTTEQAMETYGSVRVQVVDAQTDEPISEARFSVSDSQNSGFGRMVDDLGVGLEENVAPGILDLDISAKGYETVRGSLLLRRGENKDLGRLPLDPATIISGRVVDQDGMPRVAGVYYAPADWHHDPVGRIPRVTGRSTTEGDFTLSGLGRRRYAVWCRDRDAGLRSALQIVDTSQGDATVVTLVLEATAELVLNAPWPASESHEVAMLDARGLALWRGQRTGGPPGTLSYPPGEYVFIVTGAPREVSVTLTSSGAEVTLPSP